MSQPNQPLNQSLSSNAAPESLPETFALDSHTRQFFDPAEWEGAVEARFYLDMPGLRGRQFIGRIALLCSSEPVIVMMELGGDGQTLLKRPPYGLWRCDAHPSKRPHHWEQWLGLVTRPRPSGCPLPILPSLSSNPGLARLHFDAATGFGVQVCSLGQGHLFDLRDVDSARNRRRRCVAMAEFADGRERSTTLGQMGADEFHDAVDAHFRDESGALRQTMRFYDLSDDERSLEVFGCDYAALQRAVEGLRLSLKMALGPGGEFAGCGSANWYPWHVDASEALSVRLGELSWADTAPPAKLSGLMERVFAATGCKLRLERRTTDLQAIEQGIVDARTVGLEWAGEFRVRSAGVNAHEAMEAAMDLKGMLG